MPKASVKNKSFLINLKDHPMIATMLTNIAVIGTLFGGVYALGDAPPWSSVQRVMNIEQANMRTRYSQVLADLARLSSKRRTPDEDRWFHSLLVERLMLCQQLRLPKCD